MGRGDKLTSNETSSNQGNETRLPPSKGDIEHSKMSEDIEEVQDHDEVNDDDDDDNAPDVVEDVDEEKTETIDIAEKQHESDVVQSMPNENDSRDLNEREIADPQRKSETF